MFISYSFIGWACETVYCSIGSKNLVNRGFLIGPICPIYGFGAMIIIYLLQPYSGNMLTIFLAGIVATSALEYVTSVLLEKLFHLKLWDYSTYFCNINGRVCLQNSLMFGAMAVLLVWFINPFVEEHLNKMPQKPVIIIAVILFAVLAADVILTVKTVVNLNRKLAALQEMIAELANEIEEKVDEEKEKLENYAAMIKEDLSGAAAIKSSEIKAKIEELHARKNVLQSRFVNAFPNMIAREEKYAKALNGLKERINQKFK